MRGAAAPGSTQIIVGIKTAHFEAPEWVAVDRAIAAEAGGLP
jgi:hypothetical protein